MDQDKNKQTREALPVDADFAQILIDWQKQKGRHGLPWMVSDPYCRWVSEIMLQQTQVSVVIDYYQRFIAAFPRVELLAQASEESVLRLWAGLGYYSRARNLHKTAQIVCRDFKGELPSNRVMLQSLPGIGRSTAAAIASACFGAREPILDGNVKRVFARVTALAERKGSKAFDGALWDFAERVVPQDAATFNQALMDLGARVCKRTRPDCGQCPLGRYCRALSLGRQQDYPVSVLKPKRPERRGVFLLYEKAGAVFLIQRTKKAVWQKLWCLPEVEQSPSDAMLLLRFEHNFTHYRLLGEVWRVSDEPPHVPHFRWVPYEFIASEALPSPIKAVLLNRAIAF